MLSQVAKYPLVWSHFDDVGHVEPDVQRDTELLCGLLGNVGLRFTSPAIFRCTSMWAYTGNSQYSFKQKYVSKIEFVNFYETNILSNHRS